MVRWVIAAVIVLGFLTAQPVGQALENALVLYVPAAARGLEGGEIQVDLERKQPPESVNDHTCYSIRVEPRHSQDPLNRPSDFAYGCTWGDWGQAHLTTARAAGTLEVRYGNQTASTPYLVPEGMTANLNVGVEDGQLRLYIHPQYDLSAFAGMESKVAWGALASVAFLGALVSMAVGRSGWSVAWLILAGTFRGLARRNWSELPTVPTWALVVAALIAAVSLIHGLRIRGPPRSTETKVSQSMPHLDAIGLREDLR